MVQYNIIYSRFTCSENIILNRIYRVAKPLNMGMGDSFKSEHLQHKYSLVDKIALKDVNVIVNFGSVFLGNTLCNPHNVSAFLLL